MTKVFLNCYKMCSTSSSSVLYYLYFVFIIILLNNVINIGSIPNSNNSNNSISDDDTTTIAEFKITNNNRTISTNFNKFSIDQLNSMKFDRKFSDDIYLDPCKSIAIIGDIVLTESDKYLLKTNKNLRRLPHQTNSTKSNLTKMAKSKKLVKSRLRRAAIAKKERIWEHGVIPFEIDAQFSGGHRALFQQAMRHWENHTCIKFVERNAVEHPNFILFTIRPCGCCSFVGKRGNGGQAISIGTNCDKFGIVVHELGHVIGFWHEHTRPDRDEHIVIEKANIISGQENNFNKLTVDEVTSLGVPYDYESIMHYARNTFSKGAYLDTIFPIPFPGRITPEIGQRVRLSNGDIKQANLLYKCSVCGKTIQNNSGKFSSATYYSTGTSQNCEWRIITTHGERIVLNITSLDIFKSSNCESDYLEIRDGYWFKSPLVGRFCEYDKIPKIITSTGNRLVLTLKLTKRLKKRAGFMASYESVCGGKLFNNGRLESPNFPSRYPPKKECIWEITVERGYQVALMFQAFELENHDSCVYDYVEVRDGKTRNSTLLGKFCGFNVPTDIVSSSNTLSVRFVSDGSAQKSGFSATFVKEIDECTTRKNGCEQQCVNTLGSYECTCHIGYELKSNRRSCENACGGQIFAKNGTLTSPSFPDVYPKSKDCVWEITAPEHYQITLKFTHFDLEGDNYHHQGCDYDSLSVFSKLDKDNLIIHGKFCGIHLPGNIQSELNILRLVFRSDKTIQRSGFAVVFSSERNECAINNGGCEYECKKTVGSHHCACPSGYILHSNGVNCTVGGCSYEIRANEGQINSPNYPNPYLPNSECVWHISATPGHRLKMNFTVFQLEPHQECAYDHIQIYNGPSIENFTLGRFCGYDLPHIISASSNELFMVFKSDVSIQRAGFSANIFTDCGGHLSAVDRPKQFYSHVRFGQDHYGKNQFCDWFIEADPGKSIEIRFLSFDLEEDEDCSYDFVEIFDSLDDYSGAYFGRFCGNTLPDAVTSSNEGVLVRFITDETMVMNGFTIEYEAVDRRIDDNLSETTTSSSDDYIQ